MKYIDAEKLKERVTRLIASARQNDWPLVEDYLRRVIDIIDSLPQEQSEVDLKNEIERVVENYNSFANGCNVMKPSGIAKIARHFAQWGAEHLKK